MADAKQQTTEGGETGKTETGETRRKVVIAMDGSPESIFALKWYAQNLYRPNDEVLIAYAHEMHHKALWDEGADIPIEKLTPALEEEKNKAQEKISLFKKLLDEEKLTGKVHNLNTKKPGEGIVKFAKEIEAALVVTGTRGFGSIRRTILGSVSDYILHHSHVPVAVCHKEDKK